MIEVESLTKDYGTLVAVRNLSFHVGKGEVVGFLGPNGAGKSTTLRILAGFLSATSGTVKVAGFDVAEQSIEARRAVGYMPEASPLYPELRVREYLMFRARLKGLPRKTRRAALDEAMKLASVTEVDRTLIRHLSKGFRQRVGLADALLGAPPLLILDEPTAGLDPNQIREVRGVIDALRGRTTILISTHILSEVEAMCDRAIVIDRGQRVASGPLSELRKSARSGRVRLVVRGTVSEVERVLSSVKAVTKVAEIVDARGAGDWNAFQVTFCEEIDAAEGVDAALRALIAADLRVSEAVPLLATLDEVFAQLTMRDEVKA